MIRRNLATVVGYIREEVVPHSEEKTREKLKEFIEGLDPYVAPEMTPAETWLALSALLGSLLGDPATAEWKQRVSNIMGNREGVPLNWKARDEYAGKRHK